MMLSNHALIPSCQEFHVRVPAITTEGLPKRLVAFGVDDVHLLKLDCKGAEYTILESLAESVRLSQVGWIRGSGDSTSLVWPACLQGRTYTTSIPTLASVRAFHQSTAIANY
ncbi:class I SAM-dependent methyltransferase [Lacipirellula limnantheis]|uniref:Methyltransferase FkbM domain-containing protein n=1 Tax=Lacipirellula limnantheis TaxID=2528024 RepID=A0A517TTL2_9BACT|nr:hypothetical protein [Lacipirellula limnantheis]QDT71721.1 hypothetical protein I41_08810 [Lacipirellula limnantheis]